MVIFFFVEFIFTYRPAWFTEKRMYKIPWEWWVSLHTKILWYTWKPTKSISIMGFGLVTIIVCTTYYHVQNKFGKLPWSQICFWQHQLHILLFCSRLYHNCTLYWYNQLSPNTNFCIALYSRFCGFIGITFTCPVFWFEIDHEDGTMYCKAHYFEPLNQNPITYVYGLWTNFSAFFRDFVSARAKIFFFCWVIIVIL